MDKFRVDMSITIRKIHQGGVYSSDQMRFDNFMDTRELNFKEVSELFIKVHEGLKAIMEGVEESEESKNGQD